MEEFMQNLEKSLYKGFINKEHANFGTYKPKLLVNDKKKNEYVLTSIQEELSHCTSFTFSVAFVTESGLATLKALFYDLNKKGVKGRILTSTFLYFNQPKVFRELLKIKNLEVRLTTLEGFHSKGYIFNRGNYSTLIIGSSNLTAHALKVNYEWNVKLTSHENGEIIHHFQNQFNDVWNESDPLTEEWIVTYEEVYLKQTSKVNGQPLLFSSVTNNAIEEAIKIEPNKMQQIALKQIELLRETGKRKGLIISATGTGKTYLSAFDVRRFAPKKMLFIVHREQILMKAMSDFKRVLGGYDAEYGILSGMNKQTKAKYLFATIQTVSKDEVLHQFNPEEFDYILIDEVHKAGAHSYQKVINYFKPFFLMGMTATPERTDDYNIYELFDYNVAYEIRLQEALDEDMLCPFHYFGVTDMEYDGKIIDDSTLLSKLVTEERINHLIEKIEYYGHSGDKVKGLIFCSRTEEAIDLANALNSNGFNTVALTGSHTQDERAFQVSQLENGLLDYIITVDIFNEGIDIPCVNQVVMLRQTQSSIIFIQQLGRGLRKHYTKEYVTIIDFIGNYKNNYLIPIALSGDKSLNKDNIRRHMNDTSYIRGISTVNFEEIAKEQVFKAINNTKLTEMKKLREAYVELKNRIGRIPFLKDFIAHNSIDPDVIVSNHSNYYQFLVKMKEEVPVISDYLSNVLSMFSLEILNGKRKHEIIFLQLLLSSDYFDNEEYIKKLRDHNCKVDNSTLQSIERIFDLSYFTQMYRSKYGGKSIVIKGNNGYRFNDEIRTGLQTNSYFRDLIRDIVQCAEEKNKQFSNDNPLTLYQKYTRKDSCRLLNWENDESSTIYGYKIKHQTCPIFITYHKKDEIDSSVAYGDEFINPEVLKWYTRSNRTLESDEVRKIIEAQENNIDIHIFVKKDDDEGSDFYYLGKAFPDRGTIQQTVMKDKNQKVIPVVHMNMILEQSIDSRIYDYIKKGSNEG